MATLSTIPAWRIPWAEKPSRLLCPWGSPGKNTGVGGPALLQGVFPTQGSNLRLTSPALAGGFFAISTTWELCGTAK